MPMFKKRQEGKTFGNAWMYRWLIVILRYIDVRILYAFIKICIIPFTIVFGQSARRTFYYFRVWQHHGWWKSWWEVYCNHAIFGKTVIDKFSMYAGHKFKIKYQGIKCFNSLEKRSQPFMQLSSHIGCSEIIGYSYNNIKPSNVLVYGGENKSLMSYREKAFHAKNIKMIPVGNEESHSEDIVRALDNGEILYAFADRLINTNRTITTYFHGRPIKIARGPLSIAITRGLNVVMTNAMKEPDGSYTAYFSLLYYDKSANRQTQIQQLADAYMAEIEKLLEYYPLQCFNYTNQEYN